jgi:hypothetical protein
MRGAGPAFATPRRIRQGALANILLGLSLAREKWRLVATFQSELDHSGSYLCGCNPTKAGRPEVE